MLTLIIVISCTAFVLTGCSPIEKINKRRDKLDIASLGYKLVFEDNFDGELDRDVWVTHVETPIRRGGYWTDEQSFTKDGNLIIRTEYKENGSQGAGWYTGTCRTRTADNTAQSPNMVQSLPVSLGKNGAEIDIMESPFYNDPSMGKKFRNTTLHTVHVDGYMDNHQSTNSKYFKVDKDIYEEFNTYGLLWTENEYIFYINGYETWRTTFGVSQVPEYLWLSVEIAGESNSANPSNSENIFTWAGEITNNSTDKMPVDFVVDYVKVYQKA